MAATKTQTKRAVLYKRVSSDEQVEGYSLDAQDRAGKAYCDAHGWELVCVYGDEGKSAWSDNIAKRPQFARMIGDAEAGQFDVIIVHKLDRFGRNLKATLEAFDRLERVGVAVVSINESMDYSTAQGKVFLHVLGSFAQYYSDNLSTETKKGKAERKAQGIYNGLLPFGVKKNSAGIPVPDPETYPGLLLAFRAAADGKSDRDVAEDLNAAGYRTTGNRGRNPFTKDTVCRLLQNRFYLGELPDGAGGWIEGAHEALLDDDLFDRAQQARAANRRAVRAVSVSRNHRTHSLSGLAICGHCGGRLHVQTDRHGKARIYCYRGRQTKSCEQRSLFLRVYEDQIGAYLATFRLPDETVRQVVDLYQTSTEQRGDDERRRRDATNRLERIRELYKWGDMTREAYVADRDRLEADLATLRLSTDVATVLAEAANLLRNLPAAWDRATPEQRNTLLRTVVASVEIKDDRVVAVVPQPDFAPYFLARADDEVLIDGNDNGSDEAEPSTEVLTGRKRRASVAY